jgi:hypothetical protein
MKHNSIHTSTFQKPMNLYLYIPPMSTHPLSCFRWLIIGDILRYWRQNSDEKKFINVTTLFIQRLVQHGQLLHAITPFIQHAASIIDNLHTTQHTPTQSGKMNNTLYLHWLYHPCNINKCIIHNICNKTHKDHWYSRTWRYQKMYETSYVAPNW